MRIHVFRRPELDEQIRTALEQEDEAQHLLKFYMGLKASFVAVRTAVSRHAQPATIEMFDSQIERLQHDIDVAESAIACWNEALDVLQRRSKRS